jgi:uncharacterized membrane protein YkgB
LAALFCATGLVAIPLYYGTFKFTMEEAKPIEPLVANSPLFSWLRGTWHARNFERNWRCGDRDRGADRGSPVFA